MARDRNRIPNRLMARIADYRARLEKRLDASDRLAFGFKLRAPAEVLAELDRLLAPFERVKETRAAHDAALAARTAAVPSLQAFADRLQSALRAHYDVHDPAHREPHLRRPGGAHDLSVENKAAAKAKRRRTREERKTKGKRRREKIKAG